jgi:cation transport protein ChaC
VEVTALSFIVERAHPAYAGRLPPALQARLIQGGKGLSGANVDYLVSTMSSAGGSASASAPWSGW